MTTFLQNIAGLTKDEAELFVSNGRSKIALKKEIIFYADHAFNKLLYITNGLLRAFRLIEGEDFTYFFFTANEFAVDYQSYLTDTPSPLFFEAIEETAYQEFSKETIYKMYDRIPKLEKLGRMMAETAYLSAAERLKGFQTDDLETRYLALLKKKPQLFLNIPQHYIASYLGVKPQSLSRIKAKVAHQF